MTKTKLESVTGLGYDPRFGQLDTRGMPGIEEQREETFVDERFGGLVNESRFSLRQAPTDMAEKDGNDPEVARVLAEAGIENPSVPTTVHISGAPFSGQPGLLDALKEGDYETAKELFIHVLGGGAQAVLGGRKFLKDAGSSIDELGEKFGLKVKMTPENQKLRDNYGIYQADKAQAQQARKIISDDLREKYDKLTKTDREGVFYLIQAANDPEVLAKRLNRLAEAAGRDDAKVPEPTPQPLIGPAESAPKKIFHGTGGEGPLNITELDAGKHSQARGGGGIASYFSEDPTTAAQYVANNEGGKVIAGVLHPNAHLLNAREPLPADVAPTLAKAFARLAQNSFPNEDPAEAFERYSAESAASGGPIGGAARVLAQRILYRNSRDDPYIHGGVGRQVAVQRKVEPSHCAEPEQPQGEQRSFSNPHSNLLQKQNGRRQNPPPILPRVSFIEAC